MSARDGTPTSSGQVIAITGASGTLGRRVASSLAERGHIVIGIDVVEPEGGHRAPGSGRFESIDIVTGDLKSALEGVHAVVHLAAVPVENQHPSGVSVNVTGTQRVLEAAGDAAVGQVVLMSSSTVYGAWADNPVPLTEDAPLRLTPGFAFAAQKAEIERLGADWADDHPSAVLTVLRPAATLGPPGVPAWLADLVKPRLAERIGAALPPMQFVHVDDVAAAVVHVVESSIPGTFNVAPEGWINGDDLPDLMGPAPRVPLPDRAYRWMGVARRWLRREPVVGSTAFLRFPCVVAADRLRATGWNARNSSEEALVASRRPSKLGSFVARHRQEVTIAVAGSVLVAALGTAAGLVIRHRQRTRR